MIEPFPLRFLLVVLAGWVNRQQFQVVEYLNTNRLSRSPMLAHGLIPSFFARGVPE